MAPSREVLRREKDAAALIRTIVSVVAHCHSLGVIHRHGDTASLCVAMLSDYRPVLGLG